MTPPACWSGWLARLVALLMLAALLVVDTTWAWGGDDVPAAAQSAGSVVDPTLVPGVISTLIAEAPTLVPSLVPTLVPSTVATLVPDAGPTLVPDADATVVPDVIPTLVPTPGPVVDPTAGSVIDGETNDDLDDPSSDGDATDGSDAAEGTGDESGADDGGAGASPAGGVYRRGASGSGTIEVIDADPEQGQDGYLAGELVVRLSDGASIEYLNGRFGTATRAVAGDDLFYLLSVPASLDLEDAASAIRGDDAVEWVDFNYIGQAPEGRPGYFFVNSAPSPTLPEADAFAQLDAIDAVDAITCVRGAGILVAVLDTGVDGTHPDLVGRIAGTPINILEGTLDASDTANSIDDDGDGLIDEMSGHGTHVAGIVARVAPDAGILPVRVLNSDGVGDAFYLAAGIIYAADQGAAVINLSVGSTRDARAVEAAVAYAEGQGALVVAAAGNSNRSTPEYPAAYDTVLSVNAIDAKERRAGFSNYGETVDVAAPGVEIWSAAVGGGYVRWSGTSMSTPFVSGAAALIASTEGDWPPRDLTRRLVDTAVELPDGRRGESHMTRVDATRATRCT